MFKIIEVDKKSKNSALSFFLISISMLLFVLLNTCLCTAFMISPPSKTVDFIPNSTVEEYLNIINSDQLSLNISLSATGDLKDILFFENPVISMRQDEQSVPAKVLLRFPPELNPGIHKIGVQITPVLTPSKDMVFAFVSFLIPFFIRVPYPSKYADISIVVLNVDEGTPVPIFVQFDNMGSEDIMRAGAKIELYEPGGRLVANLSAPEISINKNSLGKTQAQPAPILKRGLYHAVAQAYYDDFNKIAETNFTVGEPLIRIKKLTTTQLTRDTINKVVFTASNEWNTELAATGYLEINNQKSELPSFKLSPGEEKEITGFFDTTGIVPGEYTLSITLTYANQVKTEMFPVTITEKAVIPEKIIKSSLLLIVLGIVIIAVLILIILLVIKKRKMFRERNL
jgi:hypothetical protein